MTYEFYKMLHLIGIMCLFVGLATVAILAFTKQLQSPRAKAIGLGLHGVGLFLIILAGFGMAARLQLFSNLPGWIYGKILIWALLGGAVALLRRRPQWTYANLLIVISLGSIAAYLAIYKPMF